jgi:hypothetical protein
LSCPAWAAAWLPRQLSGASDSSRYSGKFINKCASATWLPRQLSGASDSSRYSGKFLNKCACVTWMPRQLSVASDSSRYSGKFLNKCACATWLPRQLSGASDSSRYSGKFLNSCACATWLPRQLSRSLGFFQNPDTQLVSAPAFWVLGAFQIIRKVSRDGYVTMRGLRFLQILRLVLMKLCTTPSCRVSLRFFKIRFCASVDLMVASCHICLLRICDMIAGSSTCSVVHILGTLRISAIRKLYTIR